VSHLYACGKLARFACGPLQTSPPWDTPIHTPIGPTTRVRPHEESLCNRVSAGRTARRQRGWSSTVARQPAAVRLCPCLAGSAKPHPDVSARYPPSSREDHPKVQVYSGQAS